MMKTYDRVQFADETTGLILNIKREGERTIFTILTDGYGQVTCDPDQVGVLDRRDFPISTLESHESGGRIYKLFTSEINMLIWYRMAIWHDYWTKHPVKDGVLPAGVNNHQEYWDFYQAANIAELPEEKDIRRSEGIKPKQEGFAMGVTRDH